jgi:hypothetical protein
MLFKRLVKAVTGNEIELIDAPFSQISKRETVTLSSIRFDLFARTTHGMFSVDMQRTYGEDLLNRIIYYACRMISTQDVVDMQYSEVRLANVSFIMAEKPSGAKNAVRYVKASYTDTGEPFSELLNIALVYIPTVLKTAEEFSDLRIFAEFFSVKNDSDWEKFENKYKDNELGDKLMKEYSKISFNEEAMQAFAKEPYYSEKDIDRIAAIRAVKKLGGKVPFDVLADAFGLPLSEIREIAQ